MEFSVGLDQGMVLCMCECAVTIVTRVLNTFTIISCVILT